MGKQVKPKGDPKAELVEVYVCCERRMLCQTSVSFPGGDGKRYRVRHLKCRECGAQTKQVVDEGIDYSGGAPSPPGLPFRERRR